MTPKSFSVRIFLQDGHADGVKIIAKSKWAGRALVIPRTSLATELRRTELNAPGLYVLVGPSPGSSLPTIQIGSADPVCTDLQQCHVQETFWDWTLVFTAKDDSLEKTQVDYFKARLLQLAIDAKKSNLKKPCTSRLSEIPKAALAETDAFLDHILSLCPVLGLSVFEMPETD